MPESIYIQHPYKEKYFVYRVFSEAEELLYIGSTNDVVLRISDHSRNSGKWFQFAHRVDIEQFETRAEARAAERAAVVNERPLGNTRWTERDRGNHKAPVAPLLLRAGGVLPPEGWDIRAV